LVFEDQRTIEREQELENKLGSNMTFAPDCWCDSYNREACNCDPAIAVDGILVWQGGQEEPKN